jgi:flavin-dependent dehydrogenase
MSETAVSADVVVGAGMSGLVSAVRAQEEDAEVVVLEKGTRPGGSMYLSGGAIWTYDTFEEVREDVPDGDPVLQRLVIERIDEGYEWLEDLDATLKNPEFNLPGSGRQIEPPEFTDLIVEHIEANGEELLLETPMEELIARDGAIEGVRAVGEKGTDLEISAGSVILATGGFQGNERLLEQFVTEHTENLYLQANPWSTGDGLLAAEEVGAKTTKGLSKFYGHNLPAPPASFNALQFREAA